MDMEDPDYRAIREEDQPFLIIMARSRRGPSPLYERGTRSGSCRPTPFAGTISSTTFHRWLHTPFTANVHRVPVPR